MKLTRYLPLVAAAALVPSLGLAQEAEEVAEAVSDAMADEVVETIRKAAATGKIGDGKIFVLDLARAMRVRTGETDDDAL